MTLADQVAEVESNLHKARCNAAYWRVQYMFVKNICAQNNIDLRKYYEESDRTEPGDGSDAGAVQLKGC